MVNRANQTSAQRSWQALADDLTVEQAPTKLDNFCRLPGHLPTVHLRRKGLSGEGSSRGTTHTCSGNTASVDPHRNRPRPGGQWCSIAATCTRCRRSWLRRSSPQRGAPGAVVIDIVIAVLITVDTTAPRRNDLRTRPDLCTRTGSPRRRRSRRSPAAPQVTDPART
jgi:hypothetical protein